jgi:two-component system, NtrC family, sensor kinase
MRIGITGKLLSIIVPLVVFPILVTGLLGYGASEQIVTRLLNQAQMNLASDIAKQILEDFKTCRADIRLMSRLPALKDYHYNLFYGLDSEAEISRKQTEEFFQDLVHKSSLYYRVSYLNARGTEVAKVGRSGPLSQLGRRSDLPWSAGHEFLTPGKTYVSEITTTDDDSQRIIHLARSIYDVWNELAGVILVELDIEELSRRILACRVGLKGYAFVVDSAGRVLVHPDARYRGRLIGELGEPSLELLMRTMLENGQGMVSYQHDGRMVAAYTRVPKMGWIVSATLPAAEFTEHLTVIKRQVLKIVLVAGSLALGTGVFLSLHFLWPVKSLARATNVIAEGHLPREIRYESRDELGILTRSFNQMVRNLRQVQAELVKSEKLVSVGRLATGVAHEIRNPLNAIKGALVLLQRRNADRPEVLEYTDLIYEEVSRLDAFVFDFLSYARQPPPKQTMVNLNELVEEILNMHAAQAEEKKVTMKKEYDRSLPPYPMDSFQMERAIVNIVVNALEAMPHGGILTVSTLWWPGVSKYHDGAGLELSVSDTGIGLTSEQLNSAFDPFFTTKELGTGFGLPLTQTIVEAHGGRVTIESHPGVKTRVTVTLPEPPVIAQTEI